jgi:hypothetical protein
MTPEQIESLLKTIHKVLVILDDWLCEHLGLSRKPRGKYEEQHRDEEE